MRDWICRKAEHNGWKLRKVCRHVEHKWNNWDGIAQMKKQVAKLTMMPWESNGKNFYSKSNGMSITGKKHKTSWYHHDGNMHEEGTRKYHGLSQLFQFSITHSNRNCRSIRPGCIRYVGEATSCSIMSSVRLTRFGTQKTLDVLT